MNTFLPPPVVGAMLGFIVGVLAAVGMTVPRLDLSGWRMVAFATLLAVGGGVLGRMLQSAGRAKTIALWSALGAAVVGGIGFLAGFVGPIVLQPDSPQGPLLGIFLTGPVGAIVGAVGRAAGGALVSGRKDSAPAA
jgi:hypothetical protein